MTIYDLEKIPIRLVLWALAGIYLVADLALQGPLYDKFTGAENVQKIAREQGWACTVGGEPITKAQLNLAVDLHLARKGKNRLDLNPQNLKITQLAVLNEMISNELIRQWSRVFPAPVDPAEIEARIVEFESHFAPGELKRICQAQDLSQEDLHRLLTLQAKQQLWLEGKIGPAIDVTDTDVERWFELNRKLLKSPEVVRARHIFLSTVIEDTLERETLIRDLHAQLSRKAATFEELAAAHSEDERTKARGGDLGYFSRNRMPKAFVEVVFALEPGQISAPFRSKIGWHIVEVNERLEERSLKLKDVRPEIEALLENEWRVQALDSLLNGQLRTTTRAKVVMFGTAYELD